GSSARGTLARRRRLRRWWDLCAAGTVGKAIERRATAFGTTEIVMPALIFGFLVLVLLLWALNVISRVNPKVAARVTKIGGGLLSLGLAVFLGLRGEIGVAVPLGAIGLGLLGWVPFGPAGFSARTRKSGGQISRVRSAYF